jgi:hypothetical protein
MLIKQLIFSFLVLASPCLAQSRVVERPEPNPHFLFEEGAIIRGDKTAKKLALVFADF